MERLLPSKGRRQSTTRTKANKISGLLLRCCCFVSSVQSKSKQRQSAEHFRNSLFESHDETVDMHTPLERRSWPETASNPGEVRLQTRNGAYAARNSAQRHIRSVTDWLAAVRLIVLLLTPSPGPSADLFRGTQAYASKEISAASVRQHQYLRARGSVKGTHHNWLTGCSDRVESSQI